MMLNRAQEELVLLPIKPLPRTQTSSSYSSKRQPAPTPQPSQIYDTANARQVHSGFANNSTSTASTRSSSFGVSTNSNHPRNGVNGSKRQGSILVRGNHATGGVINVEPTPCRTAMNLAMHLEARDKLHSLSPPPAWPQTIVVGGSSSVAQAAAPGHQKQEGTRKVVIPGRSASPSPQLRNHHTSQRQPTLQPKKNTSNSTHSSTQWNNINGASVSSDPFNTSFDASASASFALGQTKIDFSRFYSNDDAIEAVPSDFDVTIEDPSAAVTEPSVKNNSNGDSNRGERNINNSNNNNIRRGTRTEASESASFSLQNSLMFNNMFDIKFRTLSFDEYPF